MAVRETDEMRVLVVEDDPDIRTSVARGLVAAGFAVDTADTIDQSDALLDVNAYDCTVLDRIVPGGDTVDLLNRRRHGGDATPALFLTARDAVEDRIDGFEAGGDDYLVKPFSLEELVVRVRALCRRTRTLAPTKVTVGNLVIDRAKAEVRRNGVLLPLTAKEHAILEQLAGNVDVVVSRSHLIEHCWDEVHDPMSNVVDVHISSLRRKLGEPSPISTVRGQGFILRERP
ncbi:MAG: response regulator transcription factor [Actinomycetota bacterium]